MASNEDYRRRAVLALSILNNADSLGSDRALSEARMALEGASIIDLAELRALEVS